jgi:hypothetical protein
MFDEIMNLISIDDDYDVHHHLILIEIDYYFVERKYDREFRNLMNVDLIFDYIDDIRLIFDNHWEVDSMILNKLYLDNYL